MTFDCNSLPDDVPALKGIIYELLESVNAQHKTIEQQRQQIADQQKIIEEQNALILVQMQKIEAQNVKIITLTKRVETLERQLYGRKSERLVPLTSRQKKSADGPMVGHGRQILPDHLPQIDQVHDLKPEDKVCPECGDDLSEIGTLESQQLDVQPSQLLTVNHKRHKYACKRCQASVKVADMPAQPIDKGLGTPGLLADVIVAKYQDHLPLYRQSQRFMRQGCQLSRSTLCDWMIACASLLQPLVDHMKQHSLIASGHIHTDDTPVVLHKDQLGKRRLGRMWVYINPGTHAKYPACTIYEFTESRSGSHTLTFLDGFAGHLQADAYAGYDALYKQGTVDEAACWAHARRYFFEAAIGQAHDSLPDQALHFIKALYGVERHIKQNNWQADQIQIWREQHSAPILSKLQAWLLEYKDQVLPKGNTSKAITYLLNHWQALNVYVKHGHLVIDNSEAERRMRLIALGRKNYLFMGNIKGGRAAATFYSLIETCKQHNVNTWHYFKDVLSRISTHPHSQIADLLPYNWQMPTQIPTLNIYFRQSQAA